MRTRVAGLLIAMVLVLHLTAVGQTSYQAEIRGVVSARCCPARRSCRPRTSSTPSTFPSVVLAATGHTLCGKPRAPYCSSGRGAGSRV